MRKINWLLFTLFAFTIFACKDDEDPVLDTTAPEITLTSPEDGASFEVGDEMTLSGTVTDDVAVSEVVIAIAGPVTFQDVVLNPNEASYTLSTNLQVTEEFTPGQYTVTVSAQDAAGNTDTETRTINIEGAEETALTFVVTDIPENTPQGDDIYIAGEFADGAWVEPGTNDAMMLAQNEDGTYSITLEPADTDDDGVIEYKFFRGPAEPEEGVEGWTYAEATADCEFMDNRTLDPATEGREVNNIEIAAWEDICEPTAEGSIEASGFEQGFNTLGAMDEEGEPVGAPVTFNFTGAEGIDSVNVSAVTVDGTETVNQGYNQAWFDEMGIDNTGDFTFSDEVRFPNVAAAEGETDFVVSTYRDGQQINRRSYNTAVSPAPEARRVNFSVAGPADLPEGTRVYTSGNFQPTPYAVNDPNYELTRDETTGNYTTSMYTTGDLDYSYYTIDAEGNTAWEVDEACVPAEEGTGSRDYIFDATDIDEDNVAETINFAGYGDC